MSPAGMGYLHSELNRHHTSRSAGNIVTRVGSRSITGHALPIQVHQHYGFEFHLILKDNVSIRRGCYAESTIRRACAQLERGLEGVYSCVYDDRRELPLPDKVEQCLIAHPLGEWFTAPCNCEACRDDEYRVAVRWLRKNKQWALYSHVDVCSCSCTYVEILDIRK
jgi:hypothetical protein